jgi:uncharacterized protein
VTSPPRRALVTGASAGIGRAFARQLADRGVTLVLVARRADALERLAAELPVEVEVLPANLTRDDDLARVEQRLRAVEDPIDLLVNAAGFGAYGRFDGLDVDRQAELVDLNVTALVRLTHAVLTQLRARRTGAVVNVGSTAGFQPDPYGAVYGGSKAFVRSFTEALHEELRGSGVRVQLLAPGVTHTEFQDVADVALDPLSAANAMRPDEVVAIALRDLGRGRAVSVPGATNRLLAVGAQVTPTAVSRRVSGLLHRAWAGEQP